MSDEDIAKREGTWFSENELVHPIVNTNLDVYYKDDDGNEILLLKYRKNQISDELCDLGWQSYKDLAKPSRGRGASAGPIDVKGQYFSKRAVVHTKKWSTGYLKPDGKSLKEELELLSLEDVKKRTLECQLECEESDTKEDLIFKIVKSKKLV